LRIGHALCHLDELAMHGVTNVGGETLGLAEQSLHAVKHAHRPLVQPPVDGFGEALQLVLQLGEPLRVLGGAPAQAQISQQQEDDDQQRDDQVVPGRELLRQR
jgi:hypothetical protein